MDIAAGIGAVEGAAERLLHLGDPYQQTAPPSSQQEVPVNAPPQLVPPLSLGQKVHRDVSAVTAAAQRVWQVTQQIAANPAADELFEVVLLALGQGVAAEAFQASTDALRGAIQRKRGAVDQVAAAVDAGQQAAQPGTPATAQPAVNVAAAQQRIL